MIFPQWQHSVIVKEEFLNHHSWTKYLCKSMKQFKYGLSKAENLDKISKYVKCIEEQDHITEFLKNTQFE